MVSETSKPVDAEGNPLDIPRLVALARNGDEAAFGELMQAYHQRVYGVVLGVVRNPDDARDVAQQAWIKVWNKLDTFRGGSDFFTWVYRVATFMGLDHIRKRKRQREVEWDGRDEGLPPAPVDAPTRAVSRPDEEMRAAEVQAAFEEALEGLSPEHRTALVLREQEGLSYDEIARAMRCRRGTVMSRIFYARQSVRERMKDLR